MLRKGLIRKHFRIKGISIGKSSLNLMVNSIDSILEKEINNFIKQLPQIESKLEWFRNYRYQILEGELNDFKIFIKANFSQFYIEKDFSYIEERNRELSKTKSGWREYFLYKNWLKDFMRNLKVDIRPKIFNQFTLIIDELIKNEISRVIKTNRRQIKRQDIMRTFNLLEQEKVENLQQIKLDLYISKI